MTALDRWLSRLQLSPRSQRVLAEAAFDWRHEVATAETRSEALWRHGLASVGMLRAIVAICTESLVEVVTSHWMIRLVGWQALLLLIFRAPWRGWVLQRLFTTVPVAVALTLITGPSGPSPVIGLAVIESIVCALVIAAASPIGLVGPLHRFGMLVLVLGNYIPLAFVADRVRTASSRVLAAIVFLVFAFLSPAILAGLTKALFGSIPGELVLLSVTACAITTIWLSVAWFQERRRRA